MKVLVTGPSGFLGSHILKDHPSYTPSISFRGLSESRIRSYIESEDPDVIINTAAISDIGDCEKDPDASYEANVLLPLFLSRAKRKDCKLILCSTDQVYVNCPSKGPFREDFHLDPTNVYARHKLEMEQRTSDAVIMRLTWLYSLDSPKMNYPLILLDAIRNRKQVAFSPDQHRGITDVKEISNQIEKIICLPSGVYNIGSTTDLDMYSLTSMLLEDKSLLCQGPKRPDLFMDTTKAQSHGIFFRETYEALKSCLRFN